jgi:hypothetical protein
MAKKTNEIAGIVFWTLELCRPPTTPTIPGGLEPQLFGQFVVVSVFLSQLFDETANNLPLTLREVIFDGENVLSNSLLKFRRGNTLPKKINVHVSTNRIKTRESRSYPRRDVSKLNSSVIN